jgi:hypothetical protein
MKNNFVYFDYFFILFPGTSATVNRKSLGGLQPSFTFGLNLKILFLRLIDTSQVFINNPVPVSTFSPLSHSDGSNEFKVTSSEALL